MCMYTCICEFPTFSISEVKLKLNVGVLRSGGKIPIQVATQQVITGSRKVTNGLWVSWSGMRVISHKRKCTLPYCLVEGIHCFEI